MTKQNWNDYRNKIRILFPQINSRALFEVGKIFIVEALNQYKCEYLDIDWVDFRLRQVKQTINDEATPTWQTPLPEARIAYDAPGVSELIHAMERLWRLPTVTDNMEYFMSLVEASIFESISSISDLI